MSGLLEAVKQVNLPGRVEQSLRLRVVVLLAVLLAVIATGFSGAAPTSDVVWALLALPVGAFVSRKRAGQANFGLKAVLAIGAIVALTRFFQDAQSITSVEFARQPLASLFLGVQVLHGFDLPARRDLGFTLASSLTLVALAATSTYGMWFLGVLAIYGILGVVAMLEMQRSASRQRADEWCEQDDLSPLVSLPDDPLPGARLERPGAARKLAVGGDLRQMLRLAVTVVALGGLLYSLVPRGQSTQLGGLQFRALPFRLPIPAGLIDNPGLADGGRDAPVEGEIPLDYNPAAYFGFAQHVDLRTVGTPSKLPVLRVRADRPRLWRGMVFETYTGIGWSRDAELPVAVTGNPVILERPRDRSLRARIVQTVELVSDTPNLIFAAADPVEVHLGGSVEPWSDGTLSTPATMDKGTVYSVVSFANVTPRDELRVAGGHWDPQLHARFTQLPTSLPQRVRDLAADLTASSPTAYAAAEAIEQWLGDNTEYRLDAPTPPLSGDVVDHFLFTTRQGWCEPIAASMVVLLRSVGIPARFATGFQPGTRNPITGVYDVRLDNAHAWVEVNIPGYGWVDFDPTGAVPAAVSPERQISIPLLDMLLWLRDHVVPAPIVTAVVTAARFARANAFGSLAGLALLVVGLAATRRSRRERWWSAQPPFVQLERQLAADGLTRPGGQTPRAFIAEVAARRRTLPHDELDVLLSHEEARRYGGAAVDEAVAADALQRLQARLR